MPRAGARRSRRITMARRTAAAATQIGGRSRASDAIPPPGPRRASVPCCRSWLQHGQSPGVVGQLRRWARGWWRWSERASGVARPGRLRRFPGNARLLAVVGFEVQRHGAFPGCAQVPGPTPRVTTEHLEVELDHDTGDMHGRVLKGFFAGRRWKTCRPWSWRICGKTAASPIRSQHGSWKPILTGCIRVGVRTWRARQARRLPQAAA